jgi:hypothetical protein
MNIQTVRCNTLVAIVVMAICLGSLAQAQTEDTSFALEYSYSCLSGGCHEKNTALVDGYSKSFMTHAMVKCNACHGSHTAADVGKTKPNLTGYYTGIGATGYVVGKDRCLVCHSATLSRRGHPKNPGECISCHAPHTFSAR